jgi:molybdopterin-guanine dinucleotide biosynthesis protein A
VAVGRGLRAAGDAGAALAFVCAVDMPALSVEVIEVLAGRAARLGADVVLPWDGRDHYLAAVYRSGLADRIDGLVAAGARSMRALVDIVDTQRIVMPGHAAALANVNSPEDLRSYAGSAFAAAVPPDMYAGKVLQSRPK